MAHSSAVSTRHLLITIAGGSASGKTAIAHALQDDLGPENCTVLPMDAYYKNYSELTLDDRRKLNWDTLDSIDFDELYQDLVLLKSGASIERPEFHFPSLLRTERKILVPAMPIIILEGNFCLAVEKLRKLADLKVFLDCPEEVRLERRMIRDISDRGRTPESVNWQWQSSVRPGHEAYIAPSASMADILLDSRLNLDSIKSTIMNCLNTRKNSS